MITGAVLLIAYVGVSFASMMYALWGGRPDNEHS